jgi:hypothetical protein
VWRTLTMFLSLCLWNFNKRPFHPNKNFYGGSFDAPLLGEPVREGRDISGMK